MAPMPTVVQVSAERTASPVAPNRAAGGRRQSPPIYRRGESRGRRALARNRAPCGNTRPGKILPDAAVLFPDRRPAIGKRPVRFG
jgi:hypothetical protein